MYDVLLEKRELRFSNRICNIFFENYNGHLGIMLGLPTSRNAFRSEITPTFPIRSSEACPIFCPKCPFSEFRSLGIKFNARFRAPKKVISGTGRRDFGKCEI